LAGGFLFGAFGVQGDEAGEDFGVGQVGGPAVGGGDLGIEFVVVFFQDQAVVEDAAAPGASASGWVPARSFSRML
jgi:hypothetical protein